jgi:hypothetical protein
VLWPCSEVPIRYRTQPTPAAPAREGMADDLGELQGLVSLGSLAPKDLVALDGEKFVVAQDIKELRSAFKEKGAPEKGGSGWNLLLWAGAGLVGLVALGLVWRLAMGLVGLAAIAAVGAGAVWLLLKLLRPKP